MSVNIFGQGAKGNAVTIDTSSFLKTDGSRVLIGDLNLNNKEIVNLAMPSNDSDAANKKYVDDKDSLKLSLAGGSMTGNLTMTGATEVIQATAPTTASSLCNKTYVDKMLPLAGGTMTGNIQMNGFEVYTTKAPSTVNALCNKTYVDTKLALTGGTVTGGITMSGSAVIAQATAPATASTLCNKTYVDTKLALTGGTMTGNLILTSPANVQQQAAPSGSSHLCNKAYVDGQDALKLNLAGGSLTGNLTMSGTTEVIQATAPSTANSLCNKAYTDTKLGLSGGSMTGNLTMSGTTEIIQAQAPTTTNSLCNKSYVDNLYTTGAKVSDMLVSIGTSASRAIGCGGVSARPTVAGDSKTITLNLGNPAISCVSSVIGVNPQASSLSLVSPGKTSFVNCVSSDSLPTETAKIEAVVVNGVTKGLMTVNGDIDLGPYKNYKITNSADPVSANDLANKSYVDSKASSCLPLSGGTVTGDVDIKFDTATTRTMGISDISADKTLVFKLGDDSNRITYQPKISPGNPLTIDTTDGLMVNKGGYGVAWFGSSVNDNRMYTPISMNNNKITDLGRPTNTNDATSKGYVDGLVPKMVVTEESLGIAQSTVSTDITSLRIRNVNATMSASGMNTTLLSSMTKTPTNGKLIVLSVWLERAANEWFNVDNTTIIASGYPNFQMIYNDTNKELYAWFSGTKSTAWSGRIRANFLELP